MLIIFEGRDAAGKVAPSAFAEHPGFNGARVVALEKPTDVRQTRWYFQRYIGTCPRRRNRSDGPLLVAPCHRRVMELLRRHSTSSSCAKVPDLGTCWWLRYPIISSGSPSTPREQLARCLRRTDRFASGKFPHRPGILDQVGRLHHMKAMFFTHTTVMPLDRYQVQRQARRTSAKQCVTCSQFDYPSSRMRQSWAKLDSLIVTLCIARFRMSR